MRLIDRHFTGIVESIKQGTPAARALAIADSRSLVRSLFLASAVRLHLLPFLRTPRTVEEIASHLDRVPAAGMHRLQAWLSVGVELRELRHDGRRYAIRGRRARALAAPDPLLTAHYASVLDYQTGPYQDLAELLRNPAAGRRDLSEHARVIAEVSRAAAPFVIPFLRSHLDTTRPERILDVGCGTGVYTQALLDADPTVRFDAIDLAEDVVAAARERLRSAGVGDRATLRTGDILHWHPDEAYDVVTLLNNVYYFDPRERVRLFEHLATLLRPDGVLVVVTMTVPGSIASAHLNLMLTCQEGNASLPTGADLSRDLTAAGFPRVETARLVPTEPFIGITAHR